MHELEKVYGDRMRFEVVKHDAGDSPHRIKAHGLDVHGMVIAGPGQTTVWAESGHRQTRSGVEAAIRNALGI